MRGAAGGSTAHANFGSGVKKQGKDGCRGARWGPHRPPRISPSGDMERCSDAAPDWGPDKKGAVEI